MERRAAELAGVMVASLITSFVTGLALAGPNEPVLYVVGALVPLALLLAYWLWVEPRAEADRVQARRLHQAVEDAFELSLAPDRCLPWRGILRDARSTTVRTGPQLLEGDHIAAASRPGGRRTRDGGREPGPAWTRDPDPSVALLDDISAWERRTGDEVEFARGSQDAMSFRQPKGHRGLPNLESDSRPRSCSSRSGSGTSASGPATRRRTDIAEAKEEVRADHRHRVERRGRSGRGVREGLPRAGGADLGRSPRSRPAGDGHIDQLDITTVGSTARRSTSWSPSSRR